MSDLEPLSPELKRRLDDAEWPSPPKDLADRLLPGLRSAWAAQAAVPAAPGASLPAAGARRLFGTLGAWTTAAALVVGAAGGAALHAALTAPAPTPTPAQPQEPAPAPAPAPAPVPPAPVQVDEPAPEPPDRPLPKRVVPKVAPPPASSSLAAEQQLLDGARTAVLRGEPQLALPLLEKYRREYPKGALIEEQAALHVQVLALLGRRDEATAAADRFRAQYPASMFGEAIDLAISELKGHDAGPK